jgi:toxin ParE1/3/4
MHLASRARFTPRALRDLRSIWTWVAEDAGEILADRLIDSLVVATDQLVDLPQLGTARPRHGEGLRCLVVRPYLIFYRNDVSGVMIVRVIDGRRDLEALFDNEN